MSGRSGYRKTDAKRPRNPCAQPKPKEDYVLRFVLPKSLSFALSPGAYGYGVTIGFNDIVFASGVSPAHCCQLVADFLDRIGARQFPQTIPAGVVKLLPCSAHRMPAPSRSQGFSPLGIDLEGIHDNVSRNAHNWRACSIDVGANEIHFIGAAPRRFIHDFSDRSASDRRRA
jgi:hypothetical protein